MYRCLSHKMMSKKCCLLHARSMRHSLREICVIDCRFFRHNQQMTLLEVLYPTADNNFKSVVHYIRQHLLGHSNLTPGDTFKGVVSHNGRLKRCCTSQQTTFLQVQYPKEEKLDPILSIPRCSLWVQNHRLFFKPIICQSMVDGSESSC